MELEVIKVKAWGDGQGDFVLINKEDFNPDKHQLFEPAKSSSEKPASNKPQQRAKSKT